MAHGWSALGAGLALAGLAGCAGEPAWEWRTPEVLEEAALFEHLKPRGDEKLVVANFWASW